MCGATETLARLDSGAPLVDVWVTAVRFSFINCPSTITRVNLSKTFKPPFNVVFIRIRTRGGIYGKIWPEPERFPEGAA